MLALLSRLFLSALLPVLVILCFGSLSSAQGRSKFAQQTEVSVFIPWSLIQQNLAPALTGPPTLQSYDLPDQSYEVDSVPVEIKGIHLELLAQFEPVSIDQGIAQLKTKQLIARVRVESISASKIIEQNIGGAIVRVKLDAKCDPFMLFQNDASAAIAAHMINQQGAPATEIDSVNLNWPANSWQVENILCSGPAGFADVIQKELQNRLTNADEFKNLFKDKAFTYINDKVKDLFKDLKIPAAIYSGSHINSDFVVTELEEIFSSGLVFKGSISTTAFGTRVDPIARIQMKEEWLDGLDTTKPWLFLPQMGVEQVFQKISSMPDWISTSLNKIKAFRNLLKSRWKQFFAWPDLWNFKKDATFTLMSTAVTPPKLSLSNGMGVDGSIQGDIQSWVYANRDDEVVRYLSIRTQVQGKISVGITDGNIRINWSDAQLSPKFKMDPDYVKRFRPTTRIAEGRLTSAVSLALAQGQFEIQIPEIKLSETISAKASSLRKVRPEVFAIDFNVGSIPTP